MTAGRTREDYLKAILVLKARTGFVRSAETAGQEACEMEHAISPASFCLLRSHVKARPE